MRAEQPDLAGANGFWRAHVWTGIALGELGALMFVGYLLATPHGAHRGLLWVLVVGGTILNLPLGLSALRGSARRCSTMFASWAATLLLLMGLGAYLDGTDVPFGLMMTVVVLYSAFSCPPRLVAAFAVYSVTVIGAFAVPDWPHLAVRDVMIAGIAFMLGALAVNAARNRRRHEHEVADLTSRLAERAVTDELTGLPNRRAYNEQLAAEILRSRRTGCGFVLATFDLDGFKAVNDTYGHATGDQVLRDVARAVRRSLRATDLLARTGGDEFSVICPDTGVGEMDQVAQTIRGAVVTTTQDPRAKASVGVAAFVDPFETADQLTARADAAMYREKRHQVVFTLPLQAESSDSTVTSG